MWSELFTPLSLDLYLYVGDDKSYQVCWSISIIRYSIENNAYKSEVIIFVYIFGAFRLPFYPFFFYLGNQKSYLFEIRLKTVVKVVAMCLTPLSTIFQLLYHGSQYNNTIVYFLCFFFVYLFFFFFLVNALPVVKEKEIL